MPRLVFPAGTVLFDSSSPCRRLYLLRSGWIRLSADDDAILDLLAPGTFFGQQSLLHGPRCGQTAKSVSRVVVEVFAPSAVRRGLLSDRHFTARLARSLAGRLERYEERLKGFVEEPAQARLARLLLRLAPNRPAANWVRLPVSLSNPEFARMVGTTRGRVSQFLNAFHRLGWVRRQDGLWIRCDAIRQWLLTREGG